MAVCKQAHSNANSHLSLPHLHLANQHSREGLNFAFENLHLTVPSFSFLLQLPLESLHLTVLSFSCFLQLPFENLYVKSFSFFSQLLRANQEGLWAAQCKVQGRGVRGSDGCSMFRLHKLRCFSSRCQCAPCTEPETEHMKAGKNFKSANAMESLHASVFQHVSKNSGFPLCKYHHSVSKLTLPVCRNFPLARQMFARIIRSGFAMFLGEATSSMAPQKPTVSHAGRSCCNQNGSRQCQLLLQESAL